MLSIVAGVGAFALLAVAVSVFAVGECLHGAIQPTLVVDLADPRLLGRYMAISALSWQVGFTIGPAVGGVLLGATPGGLWLIMAVVLVAMGAATLSLERQLPESLRRTPRSAQPETPVATPAGAPASAGVRAR
jgi:MFS family permease